MRPLIVSLYLDIRKPLKEGRFNVKIQASQKVAGKWQRMYLLTGVQLTRDEWSSIQNINVRGYLKEKRTDVHKELGRAMDIIKDAPFISLESFRAIFQGGGGRGAHLLIERLYEEKIRQLVARNQYGTSTIYQSAINCFKKHYGPGLSLEVIDRDFLESMNLGISRSTAGMYLRTLRTVFNSAITKGLISRDSYPFGSGGFTVPSSTKFKRALTVDEKNLLLRYKPVNDAERAALDVWRVSYYCNGMNMADLARLSSDQVSGDLLVYTRKKTARTKDRVVPIVIVIRKEILTLLSGKKRIFDCLTGEETAEQERKKVVQWTKTTNKYLKRIGEKLNLPVKLTTYVARHTFATISIRQGTSKALIQEALGHSSMETTENYLAGFDLETKRKMSQRL